MTLDCPMQQRRVVCARARALNEGEEIKIHRSAREASIGFSFSRTAASSTDIETFADLVLFLPRLLVFAIRSHSA